MIILVPFQEKCGISNTHEELPTVLIFGVGLIGTSIVEKLFGLFPCKMIRLAFSWNNEYQQLDTLHKIILLTTKSSYVEIIWSAGKSSFFSKNNETHEEFKTFKKILSFLGERINCNKNVRLISSAGGLYEGERIVGIHSQPIPKRPYGELKKKQEDYLLSLDNYSNKSIIRLSSVYGYIKKNQRIGLISTLIKNTIENKETTIFGNFYTLRDYLFIDDMTRFFVENILFKENQCDIFLLSSNKPISILEAIKTVENVLRKKSMVCFTGEKNSKDITYCDKKMCEQYVTPLNVGIKKILLDFSNSSNKLR